MVQQGGKHGPSDLCASIFPVLLTVSDPLRPRFLRLLVLQARDDDESSGSES